jgi:hypothetical protein
MLETDYLVVGAGASGMAFVDTLLSLTDARVVLVDREPRPGGHWLHAYPFVQLHQPSANYGVPSRRLGEDRVDTDGPNAGYYERASAPQICDYFGAVLDDLVAGGRVTFLGSSDYVGPDGDGHRVVSLETGVATTVRARKVVDATFVASEIPSRHTPPFAVDDGVQVVPPNDLPALTIPRRVTVVGAGKTAMDTITWLLDNGVDADRIRWVKPREAWLFERGFMQPLDLVPAYMRMQAHWVSAAATAVDGFAFARQLEEDGVLVRVDPDVEPEMFRGATISRLELEKLRSISDVAREGKVRRVAGDRVALDGGEIPAEAGELFVDCTAHGVPDTDDRPVFTPGKLTLAYVTLGITPWSAATVAAVEASRDTDEEKNRLCPTLQWTGRTSDLLTLAHTGMTGLTARTAEPDLGAWNEGCRLNPAAGAMAKAADPEISAALTTIITNIGPALENLGARAGAVSAH